MTGLLGQAAETDLLQGDLVDLGLFLDRKVRHLKTGERERDESNQPKKWG
jgi:hypothetical protein